MMGSAKSMLFVIRLIPLHEKKDNLKPPIKKGMNEERTSLRRRYRLDAVALCLLLLCGHTSRQM